jgi:hypothetical protein
MASNPGSATPLRWLRALVAAFVAELALIIVAIPIFSMAANPTPTLNMIIPPASGLLFLVAGCWSALPVPQRGIWQGVLTGIWAVALSLALGVAATLAGKGNVTDGFTPAYLTAHVLKVIGGAIGGWLVSRKARATPGA